MKGIVRGGGGSSLPVPVSSHWYCVRRVPGNAVVQIQAASVTEAVRGTGWPPSECIVTPIETPTGVS